MAACWLARNGADLAARTSTGRTVLQAAARTPRVVKTALAAGASPRAINDFGVTVVGYAAGGNQGGNVHFIGTNEDVASSQRSNNRVCHAELHHT